MNKNEIAFEVEDFIDTGLAWHDDRPLFIDPSIHYPLPIKFEDRTVGFYRKVNGEVVHEVLPEIMERIKAHELRVFNGTTQIRDFESEYGPSVVARREFMEVLPRNSPLLF